MHLSEEENPLGRFGLTLRGLAYDEERGLVSLVEVVEDDDEDEEW